MMMVLPAGLGKSSPGRSPLSTVAVSVGSRPKAAAMPRQTPTRCRFQPRGNGGNRSAARKALLVVEDDVLIRMLLADMLGEIGYTVAAEAGSVDEALEATRKTDFDLAILDADLKGRSVSPVADALIARSMGFLFGTGLELGMSRFW